MSTSAAPVSESGIATRLISALRHENMNSASTRTTRSEPRSSASVRLSIESSTNVAGRKIVVSILMPGRPGFMSLIASSTPLRHVERVGERELLDDEQEAGPAVDDRVAVQRLVVDLHGGDVAERERAAVGPGRAGDRHRREVLGRADRELVLDVEALVRRVDPAAGADEPTLGELAAADESSASDVSVMTCSSETLFATSFAGSVWTWSCSSCSPQIGTLATPGIPSSRARIFQYAIVDSWICESVSDRSPIFITRLVADSGWIMTGGAAQVGSWGVATAMRSCDELTRVEEVGARG